MTETNNLNQTQTGLRVHIVDTEKYFTTSRIIIIMHRDWQSNRTICKEYWSLLSGCS